METTAAVSQRMRVATGWDHADVCGNAGLLSWRNDPGARGHDGYMYAAGTIGGGGEGGAENGHEAIAMAKAVVNACGGILWGDEASAAAAGGGIVNEKWRSSTVPCTWARAKGCSLPNRFAAPIAVSCAVVEAAAGD